MSNHLCVGLSPRQRWSIVSTRTTKTHIQRRKSKNIWLCPGMHQQHNYFVFMPWIDPLSRIIMFNLLVILCSSGQFNFQWVCGIQHVPSDARVHYRVWTLSTANWCTSSCCTYLFLLSLSLHCDSLCPSVSYLWPALRLHLLPVLLTRLMRPT